MQNQQEKGWQARPQPPAQAARMPQPNRPQTAARAPSDRRNEPSAQRQKVPALPPASSAADRLRPDAGTGRVRNVVIEPTRDTGKNEKKKSGRLPHRVHLQPWRDISWPRRITMILSGLLFLWCIAPAFFSIRGIGVIASSAVMLGIFLAALLWHLIDEHHSVRMTVLCMAVGLLFSAGVIAFCAVSGIMLKASMTTVPADCPNYTVVVLGCKAAGSHPSWMLEDRLNQAYRVLTENPDVMCVVTGGQGDDEEYTEAYVMKKYLTEKGISPDRIIMEEASGSTEENLLYTKAVIELNGLSRNIVIVTDRFHELRARIWAEKTGFQNIYAACCETRPYLVVGYWFREMFGLARLYFFGV